MLKLGKNTSSGQKFTPEDLAGISIEDVKKLITEQIPDAFEVKAKPAKKVVANKKASPKKAVAKKAITKKK